MAKRIISGIGSSFLVLIFLTLIILHFSGYRYYVPESSSMHPAVPKFSLVYVKKTEKLEDLEIGDVIAFQGSEKPVLHRIIKIDGEMIQTQGDANNAPDAPIYLNQVIGKMVFSIPYLGILFGSAYPWLILLSLIIILYLARQLIKDIKKEIGRVYEQTISDNSITLNARLYNCSVLFVTFAWYVSLDKTDPIIINTGSLRVECKFYRGIDSNYDGDLDDDSYVEITEADLHFVNVIPGQVYTFKLTVTNIGTVSGFLSVRMNDIFTEEEELLNYFIVSFSEPTETEILLSAAEAGRLELFNKYILEAETTFQFIFQIKVGNISDDKFHLKTMTIEHFIVDLIQVHSEE